MFNPTLLVRAARTGDLKAVTELLQSKCTRPPTEVSTALNEAAFNGHLEIVKALLKSVVDINARPRNDMTALDCAVANLHLPIVQLLLANGADVNAQDEQGWAALHSAIDIETETAFRLNDDGDVDAVPTTEVTSVLLAHGADVTIKTTKGQTPLDLASRGHLAAADLLRKFGAIERPS